MREQKIALHLEKLEAIKSVRPGNARDLERFTDLLDVLVVNLKEVNRHEELVKWTLYASLCKKLNESALADYHRWMYEKGRWEFGGNVKGVYRTIGRISNSGFGDHSGS